MNKYIYFGEEVEGYDIAVLNEREARAAAGILLLPAMFSFFNAYLTHNFYFTKLFVTLFMLDFIIRIFINPKYAPSLILGRIFVQNQDPEYVGAKQKKFAWSIGLVLSISMFFIIVVLEIMTPIKIIICLLCIALLFSETAFGICLGCIVYHKTQSSKAQYCPGNVCEIKTKHPIQKISKLQYSVLGIFIVGLFSFNTYLYDEVNSSISTNKSMKCEAGKCGSSRGYRFQKPKGF